MHIDLSKSRIVELDVNFVGNKSTLEPLILSRRPIVVNEDTSGSLNKLFIGNIKSLDTYCFYHDSGIRFNVVYELVYSLFQGMLSFKDVSHKISSYLYDQCTHPNIKSGEFYLVRFEGCFIDGLERSAIGLFKTENRDTYIDVDYKDGLFTIDSKIGIDINKLDKGCLIFDQCAGDGYIVKVVDNTNKSEAQYWIDDFLHLKQRSDEYHMTSKIMQVTKNFITKEMPKQYCISKADQTELINRTIQYFKQKEEFDIEEFADEVIEEASIIESFNNYSAHCLEEEGIDRLDAFYISDAAVKKQSRSFKSVIKLDKNFHIYVHGDRRMIEQGEDEKGRYYKVYFKEEF